MEGRNDEGAACKPLIASISSTSTFDRNQFANTQRAANVENDASAPINVPAASTRSGGSRRTR
jgi:hypothetical protein